MRRRHRSYDDEIAIDLTPLIDVVFILLIFFVVTATFVQPPGLDVTRPAAATARSGEPVSGILAIDADNRIWAEGRPIGLAQVEETVRRLLAEAPRGRLVIEADVSARTGLLVRVIDQARLGGAQSVAVATRPEHGGAP